MKPSRYGSFRAVASSQAAVRAVSGTYGVRAKHAGPNLRAIGVGRGPRTRRRTAMHRPYGNDDVNVQRLDLASDHLGESLAHRHAECPRRETTVRLERRPNVRRGPPHGKDWWSHARARGNPDVGPAQLPGAVDGDAVEDRVRPGKVDVLEEARRPWPRRVNA